MSAVVQPPCIWDGERTRNALLGLVLHALAATHEEGGLKSVDLGDPGLVDVSSFRPPGRVLLRLHTGDLLEFRVAIEDVRQFSPRENGSFVY